MEPKWFHPGAVLENGATLEGGAVLLSLIIMFEKKKTIALTKVHSQCVTNIEVSQAFSSWSNVGRPRFDQHLVK